MSRLEQRGTAAFAFMAATVVVARVMRCGGGSNE